MRSRKKLWALAGILFAVLALAACGDTIVNVDVDQNTAPTPAPSVQPSASPVPGTSAGVTSVGIYAFGYENDGGATCVAPPDGQRQNAQGQYIVPAGCRLALTATAFEGSQPLHLPDNTPIAWSILGPGRIENRPPTAFNKNYYRLGPGIATVEVQLAGKVGSRGFENQ